jgi:hypothetical protein
MSKEHTSVQTVSAETANVMLGSVQAVSVWAQNNGLTPEDAMVRRVCEDEVVDTQPQQRAVGARRNFGRPSAQPYSLKVIDLRRKRRSGILAAVDGSIHRGCELNELAPLTATDVIIDAARISSPSTSRRTKSGGAVSRPSVRRGPRKV